MAIVNLKKRQIECKIVYYGPGLCGKTTNLQQSGTPFLTPEGSGSATPEASKESGSGFVTPEMMCQEELKSVSQHQVTPWCGQEPANQSQDEQSTLDQSESDLDWTNNCSLLESSDGSVLEPSALNSSR